MYAIATTTHGHFAYWSEWGGWSGWSDWLYQARLFDSEEEASSAIRSIGLGSHAIALKVQESHWKENA